MDDQRSEILAPTGRVRVDEPLARPAQPGGVVSHRPRRSWGRRLFWLLLAAAIVAAAISYFPRPEPQPKNAGRPAAAATATGQMSKHLAQLKQFLDEALA